jgi:hypothetical protein
MSDTQNEKAQKAAELVADAYGVTVGTMYELLQKGASGDAVAVKSLSRMGMVVGSTVDVVKFIDAASRDDVRTQITSSCSIAGGIAGGMVGSGVMSVVVGYMGSKAGEKLCGELYDKYIEYQKSRTDDHYRSTHDINSYPKVKTPFSNDFEQMKDRVSPQKSSPFSNPDDYGSLEVPARYAALHNQVNGHINRLFTEKGVHWGDGGDNTVAACTVECVKQKVTDVEVASVGKGNIHLGQKMGYEWNVASIDAVQAARTPQQESFAQLVAFDQQLSQQQDKPTQTQTKTRSGPTMG